VIKMRRAQLSFGDGLIRAEIEDLREDWMAHADQGLEDEQLVATIYEALAKRHPNSRRRGLTRHTGRRGVALIDPQARSQLEL
jgi:IS5 family transposase